MRSLGSEQSPEFVSGGQVRRPPGKSTATRHLFWIGAPMWQRALFIGVAFWLSNGGGSGYAQELPESSQSYLAGKARLLAADAALRFDAGVPLDAREVLVNDELLRLRRALTA